MYGIMNLTSNQFTSHLKGLYMYAKIRIYIDICLYKQYNACEMLCFVDLESVQCFCFFFCFQVKNLLDDL